ncbi:hypothetical protein ACFL0B_00145 [Thermodesulfobacteriota bacterium]
MYKNKFTMEWLQHADKTITDAYEHIRMQLVTSRTKFWAVSEAKKMASEIIRQGQFSLNDIHQDVFWKFIELRKHEEYDEARGSLYTYTAYHTYYGVKSLKKNLNISKIDEAKFLYAIEDEYKNLVWISESFPKGNNKPWKSLMKSQSDLFDRLIESENPEDILIKRDFWNVVNNHYDEIDVMVLIGKMKKTEAAAEKNMKYDAYCKSLQRKNESFRIIATEAGYC